MHRYSTDNDNYVKMLVGLTIASAIFNAIINIIIIPSIIKNNFLIQLVSLVLSYFITFELIFEIFDKLLWKFSVFNKFIKCPNISGKWKGTIDNHEFPKVNVDVEIKQSWTKISIKLQSKNAKSKTKALTFFVEDSDNPEICYVYFNESTTKKLTSHGGTGILTFLKDENRLVGYYYTDKHRENNGDIILEKIEDFSYLRKLKCCILNHI